MLDRRTFVRKGMAAVAAAGIELIPGEARADVPRHFSWQQGLAFLMKEGEKKTERADDFFVFTSGKSTWADTQAQERTKVTLVRGDPDWQYVAGRVAGEGEIVAHIRVHTHPPELFKGKRLASLPSPTDLKSLIAHNQMLANNWENPGIVPKNLRARDMTVEELVLDTGMKCAWRLAFFPRDIVLRRFPKVLESTEKGSPEELRRHEEVDKAFGRLVLLSSKFNGDIERLRKDREGAAAYQAFMERCADVGILMRYIPAKDLLSTSPNMGVL